jgi:hypothetical protein
LLSVFRINRGNQDIYQALPLDTNIIAKDKSNFLIKRSKNVTLVSNELTNVPSMFILEIEPSLVLHIIPSSTFSLIA